jgi:hypothetical protein
MLMAAVVCLSACQQQINQIPFSKFAAALSETEEGVDRTTGIIEDWSQKRTIQKLSATLNDDLKKRIRALDLEQIDEDVFDWENSGAQPLNLTLTRYRSAFNSLNRGLAKYAEALESLADPAPIDPEGFNNLRGSLNADLKNAAAKLGEASIQLPNNDDFEVDEFALFSTLAIEGAKAHTAAYRRKLLIEQMNTHQRAISAAAELGSEATVDLALVIWKEYADRVMTYQLTAGSEDASSKERANAIENILELNEQMDARLDVLRTLNDTYTKLPAAHAELIADLGKKPEGLASVRAIYDNAKRIYDDYGELRKKNKQANE